MVVFEEGGVAVDVAAEAFSQDEFGVGDVEAGVKVGAGGALDAVIGPEGLRAVGDLDALVGLLAGVGRGEGDVAGGVPVLGEDDVFEAPGEAVDDGDDLVALGYGQRASNSINGRAEVVLDVDNQQYVSGLELHDS